MRMLEHQFTMITAQGDVCTVYRTSRICVLVTPRQADRCYNLLRSGGDVWAWLIDLNRQRFDRGDAPIVSYQELCRELATRGSFGELSVAGARSVLRRYSDAWFEAAKRRRHGQHAGFPRRRRSLVPVRFYNGTFEVAGHRVRLQMAKGRPELWIRLSRPLCYPPEQVRAITLLHDAGRLWLAVTAAIPIQRNDLDPARVAGVDLGIIHPYAVAADQAALLISGRAIRAENYLHLKDLQARQARAARRIPNRGQQGSRRWRRYRYKQRQAEARHRRRVYQAHHQAAKQVVSFALQQRVGVLVVGDPKGIADRNVGRVQNLRLRQWRRTHLMQVLRDKSEQAGIAVLLVDERGTSSTCPACRRRVSKPAGRRFYCPSCSFQGHRDLVGAANIAALGGGNLSAASPALVEHRRAGIVPDRRDRRRHLYDRRRRSCLVSGHPKRSSRLSGCRSLGADLPHAPGEDQAASSNRRTLLEGTLQSSFVP
jgi:IS605 OrfB family transposase